MSDFALKLQEFWSSFGILAFPEGNVPAEVNMPYITYTVPYGEYLQNGTHQVRLWYKETGFANIYSKADEISEEIGNGKRIALNNGKSLVLYKGTPYIQIQPSDDIERKILYINFMINYNL